jgi:hypothetical protein
MFLRAWTRHPIFSQSRRWPRDDLPIACPSLPRGEPGYAPSPIRQRILNLGYDFCAFPSSRRLGTPLPPSCLISLIFVHPPMEHTATVYTPTNYIKCDETRDGDPWCQQMVLATPKECCFCRHPARQGRVGGEDPDADRAPAAPCHSGPEPNGSQSSVCAGINTRCTAFSDVSFRKPGSFFNGQLIAFSTHHGQVCCLFVLHLRICASRTSDYTVSAVASHRADIKYVVCLELQNPYAELPREESMPYGIEGCPPCPRLSQPPISPHQNKEDDTFQKRLAALRFPSAASLHEAPILQTPPVGHRVFGRRPVPRRW